VGSDSQQVLVSSQLSVSVPGRVLVADLSFAAAAGEFIAVLGQNGCGKSLTMMTLAGLRPPDTGVVHLLGSALAATPRQVVAKSLALLPQHSDDMFPASVMDTVMTGRHPHIGRFSWESADDIAIASAALQKTGIGDLADRDVMTLSGGERRRLAIAQVLTQQPAVFLLDEPTNHLDPQHQIDALEIFRRKADEGAVIIASLHDANLAARYADRCLLLYGDGNWDLGDSDDILDAERLTRLYETPIEAVPWRAGKLFVASGSRTQST
jgi:iron complex transport system ATP-binding protein